MTAASYTGSSRSIRFVDPLKQRGRTLLVVLACVAAAIGIGAAAFFSIRAGGVGGAGLSVLYALIPVPFLAGAYIWLDAYEPEPRRYLATAFLWGAVGAVAIALALQMLAQQIWDMPASVSATYAAPLTEEPAKGLILLFTFLRRRRVIDGVVDGFVYAGIAALGFAFTENILYYTTAYVSASEVDMPGALGATGTFFGRGVLTPFLHPLFTSWFGLGLGLAVLSRGRVLRVLFPTLGMAVGMLAHGCWNGAATSQNGFAVLCAYVAGLVLLGGLLTWALFARRNEGRVLWESLTDMAVRRRWLHVDEVPYLARMGLRKRARSHAKRTASSATVQAVKTYQQLATRTAFLYDGVMRGRPKRDAVQRIDHMRADMTRLRSQIVLPPPVRIVKRLPKPVYRPMLGYPPPNWRGPTVWPAAPPQAQQAQPPPGSYGPPPGQTQGGPPRH